MGLATSPASGTHSHHPGSKLRFPSLGSSPVCACQLNEAVGSGRKGRLLPMAVIVLVWISKKQSLRWGFLRRQYIRGVCSGEKEQKNENRAKEKIKRGYGLDGFSVVPSGALGHKLYHEVDVMFRKDYLLPLVSHQPLEGGGICITSRWRQPTCDQGQPCKISTVSCWELSEPRRTGWIHLGRQVWASHPRIL